MSGGDGGFPRLYFRDLDADGFGSASSTVTAFFVPDGYVVNDADCDDNRADVSPGGREICNGLDDDCDGITDEDDGLFSAPVWYADSDGDGFTENGGDCTDTDPGNLPAHLSERVNEFETVVSHN